MTDDSVRKKIAIKITQTWSYQMRMIIFVSAFALLTGNSVLGQSQDGATTSSKNVVTFLSHRSGHSILYKMKPDGTDIKPLFGGEINDVPSAVEGVTLLREPHWTRQSPNGRFFASWVYETGKPYSLWQGPTRAMLWVGDLDGKWSRVVNPDCDEEFAWSPDGTRIAFSVSSSRHNRGYLQSKANSTQIYCCGIDGSNIDCVLEYKGNLYVQDWSSDGKRLLLIQREFKPSLSKSTSTLYEFRLDEAIKARAKAGEGQLVGSEWTATTAGDYLSEVKLDLSGMVVSEARYSPDGNTLAMFQYDPNNMFAPNLVADPGKEYDRMMRLLSKLITHEISTGKSKVIADYADGMRGPICWSHDGSKIFFSRYLARDDNREKTRADKEHGLSIWSVGRDGKKAQFITTGWSPDCGRNRPEK